LIEYLPDMETSLLLSCLTLGKSTCIQVLHLSQQLRPPGSPLRTAWPPSSVLKRIWCMLSCAGSAVVVELVRAPHRVTMLYTGNTWGTRKYRILALVGLHLCSRGKQEGDITRKHT
jgi:hypothetical protein